MSTIVGIVLLYAVSLAITAALPAGQIVAANVTLTLFVILDLRSGRRREENQIPRWSRMSMFLARYATAFAVSSIACLAVFLVALKTQPTTLPASNNPWFAVAFEPLLHVVGAIVSYVLVFSLFSMLGFVASVCVLRRFPQARWFALINVPGVAIMCWFVLVGCVEYVQA